MTIYRVELSRQDLSDFLDDDAVLMERYRAELERRLSTDGDTAEVAITSALSDKFMEDDADNDEAAADYILPIMAQMVEDWDWANSDTMEMFTDLAEANARAVETGAKMWQTFTLPEAYAVGEFTAEQEDDAEFMESVEGWSEIETDYTDTEEEKEAAKKDKKERSDLIEKLGLKETKSKSSGHYTPIKIGGDKKKKKSYYIPIKIK